MKNVRKTTLLFIQSVSFHSTAFYMFIKYVAGGLPINNTNVNVAILSLMPYSKLKHTCWILCNIVCEKPHFGHRYPVHLL